MIFKKMIRIEEILFASYIIFNFIDRQISYICLLLLLSICIYNIFKYKNKIYSSLIISVIIFSSWISISAYINNTPLHELDNYYRFLLLLPLLFNRISSVNLDKIIIFSFLFALIHFIFTYSTEEPLRYLGSSNNAITYASVCSILILICFYKILSDNLNKRQLLLYFVIVLFFAFCIIATESRGPVIGLIPAIILMCILFRNFKILPLVLIPILLVIYIDNPLKERFKRLAIVTEINKENINDIEYSSVRERIVYLMYGIDRMKKNYLYGIGSHNVHADLAVYIDNENLIAHPRDHLHNDIIDITVKFGFMATLLLMIIYYMILKTSYSEKSISIVFPLVLFFIISQITQSQFAHSQITTMIITLIYIFSTSDWKKKEIN